MGTINNAVALIKKYGKYMAAAIAVVEFAIVEIRKVNDGVELDTVPQYRSEN